jgi:ribonuclease J
MTTKKDYLRFIPLGGTGEVGKNMLVFETNSSMIIVDAGISFPSPDMLGIDLIAPDVEFLKTKKNKIKALVITHGHEDHIGAVAYLLKNIDIPVIYATRFTMGLIEYKLKEAKVKANLQIVAAGDVIEAGDFTVEYVQTTHSIPDGCGIYIKTPAGSIYHTGDFKLDPNPIDGRKTDFERLSRIADEGIDIMLSDSTNVDKPGYTASEKDVYPALKNAVEAAPGRVIFTTFSSNIHRLQQAINLAQEFNRKVVIAGRSIKTYIEIASKYGYMNLPDNIFVKPELAESYKPEDILILSTGSQGETQSVLNRIANGTHKDIKLMEGDTVILSSKAIPGNERSVSNLIDNLYKAGANVLYNTAEKLHVSGHASQEEQKVMLSLMKPKYFIPTHGEFWMLIKHGRLAYSLGMDADKIILANNGDMIEYSEGECKIVDTVDNGIILLNNQNVITPDILEERQKIAMEGLLSASWVIDSKRKKVISKIKLDSFGCLDNDQQDDIYPILSSDIVGYSEELLTQSSNQETYKIKINEMISQIIYKRTKKNPQVNLNCMFI